ncbi:MAG: integrase core domain-containing protein [Byssovorax sp.]
MREESMLSLFSGALMEHGKPDALYLDNGATYRGAVLQLACSRLGITLLHAKPYDAPARGKMERFWRRLREEALGHLGEVATLADIEAKLRAWLTRYYQVEPHAGLLGRAPATVFAEGEKVLVSQDQLKTALTVRTRRRVRRDTTVTVGGLVYEVPLGYLAGQIVTLVTSLFDGTTPAVELDDNKRVPLRVVDPVANASTKRPPRHPAPGPAKQPVDFDPSRTLTEQDDDADIF